LLAGLDDRWSHVQEVAAQAQQVSVVLAPEDRPYLVAGAWLHDVGYALALNRLGFHAPAIDLDVNQATARDRAVIIPLVLVVVLLILAALLRAIVAPLLLIVTVILSFAAALGVSLVVYDKMFGFAGAHLRA
jgi:predicted RND superfamily exporter protein